MAVTVTLQDGTTRTLVTPPEFATDAEFAEAIAVGGVSTWLETTTGSKLSQMALMEVTVPA